MALRHPVTQDGRYFVVKGRLWRLASPHLSKSEKSGLVLDLMRARRAVKAAKKAGGAEAEAAAHHDADVAKRALGERGPVWWKDDSADLNRYPIENSPYVSWFTSRTAESA